MLNKIESIGFWSPQKSLSPGASAIFTAYYKRISIKTDLIFAGLFIFQWALAIVFALTLSPLSWNGTQSSIHLHVYLAVVLGGALAMFPIFLSLRHPGAELNRFVAAFAQICFTVLFVHLTGGRIETHFHLFGSLAFLAFYRDARVLVLASVLTLADHLVQGAYTPLSIYGVLNATPWRAIEHAAWVVFENVFLIISIQLGLRELASIAEKQYRLAEALTNVEKQIVDRTADLVSSRETILLQQKELVASSKMAALGEMAEAVAHEVNNPIAIIKSLSSQLTEMFDEKCADFEQLRKLSIKIEKNSNRVAEITGGLKTFSNISFNETSEEVTIAELVDQAMVYCQPYSEAHQVKVIRAFEKVSLRPINGRPDDLVQIFIHIINNSIEAIANHPGDKWIRIGATEINAFTEIAMEDSGPGISEANRARVFQPFFSTKPVGKGVGLGLSIALGLAKSHGGDLLLDANSDRTKFIVKLPNNRRSSVELAA